MSEPILVTREKVLNSDFVSGLLISAPIPLLILVFLKPLVFAVISCAFLLMLVLISWRKHLKRLSLTSPSGPIVATTILPFVTFNVPIETVEVVRLRKAISLSGKARTILVIRKKGKLQPMLFEVWTDAEQSQVRAFTDELRKMIPDKCHF